jgi:hypothetical protein
MTHSGRGVFTSVAELEDANPRLPRPPKCQPQALRLDQDRRCHPCQGAPSAQCPESGQKWVPNVGLRTLVLMGVATGGGHAGWRTVGPLAMSAFPPLLEHEQTSGEHRERKARAARIQSGRPVGFPMCVISIGVLHGLAPARLRLVSPQTDGRPCEWHARQPAGLDFAPGVFSRVVLVATFRTSACI